MTNLNPQTSKTLSSYQQSLTKEQFDLLIPETDLYEAHVRERMYQFFVQGKKVSEIIRDSKPRSISRGVLSRQLESVLDKMPDDTGKVVLKLWVKFSDATLIEDTHRACLVTPPVQATKLSSSLFRGSLTEEEYKQLVIDNRSREMAFMSLRSTENGRLYFVKGLTVNEISAITGSPIITIKAHLKRIAQHCLSIEQALIPVTLYIDFQQALRYAAQYKVVRYHINIAN